ncbi:hypothetical protein SLA2020_318660 [Shorea laevis]
MGDGLVLMIHVSCHHRGRDKIRESENEIREMGRLLQLHPHWVQRTPRVQDCNIDYAVESAQYPEIVIRDGQVQSRCVRICTNLPRPYVALLLLVWIILIDSPSINHVVLCAASCRRLEGLPRIPSNAYSDGNWEALIV